MFKTISLLSISLEHVIVSYWPYIEQHFLCHDQSVKQKAKVSGINIIYNNLMIGLTMGMSFFYLLPISNQQLKELSLSSNFPYGTLIAIITFMCILVISNYFYQSNSSRKALNRSNFLLRSQFQHQTLSNPKLKLHRRLPIQSFRIQILVNIPSILLLSALIPNNQLFVEFWLLIIVLFQKYYNLESLGRSYYAMGMGAKDFALVVAIHLIVNIAYFIMASFVLSTFQHAKGFFNAIAAGIIIYDVMIQKLTRNYQQKQYLFQKITFFFTGIFLSCMILLI